MSSVLIVGATRGLGASLTKMYAQQDGTTVYGTTRSNKTPADFPGNVKWIQNIDLMDSKAADELVAQLKGARTLDSVIITAGFFHTEDLSLKKGPNWDDEVRMYTTSSIAPVFIVHRLLHAGLLKAKSKIVFVSSESGSITLRHEVEGGGNYAHHASKAALNMTAKLLSMDLKGRDIIVSTVHPGFMRTEMTKGVGFDKYWDEGGAVTPDEAARSLVNWIADLDISKTGQYWAPRGAGDIGTAEAVLGKNLAVPLQLPW